MALASDPLPGTPDESAKRSGDELVGLHSARRGDYRVVYATLDVARRLDILHIGRRSDVYRG